MNDWSIKEIKRQAKDRLKVNYLKSVLVGIVIAITTGGLFDSTYSGSSMSTSSSSGLKDVISGVPKNIMFAIGIGTILLIIFAFITMVVIKIFLINPIEIGCDRFFHKNLEEKAELKEMLYSYDKGYKNGVKTLFLRNLYLTLWSCLFIIPGIIKQYEYRLIPYILSENPDMDSKEVFRRSKQMMNGYKWKAFLMDLSFLLWEIVGILTFGILNVFYVNPYKKLAEAGLYKKLKEI